MCINKERLFFQYGFSLLEVLLSLSIMSAILLASQSSLYNLWHQAGWWLMLNNMTTSQWQAHQVFMRFNEQVCKEGLTASEPYSWQWYLNRDGICELHDIRYVTNKGYWQKRRQGGRFTTFLGDVKDVSVVYGLSLPGECYVNRWVAQVAQAQLQQVVMLNVTLKTGVKSNTNTHTLPNGWNYAVPSFGSDAEHNVWLWQPLSFVLTLPCELMESPA